MLARTGDRPIELVGGVVAFNEEHRLASAVQSLLEQKLPPGIRWRAIWIVASGCTDGTPRVAESLSARHPEVRTMVQPERRGKASALGDILRAARGDFLVLLNADAVAGPGAVSALLAAAEPLAAPYAVMGRPEPAALPRGSIGRSLHLLWSLHHRLHEDMFAAEEGTHLSDELLLLPTSDLPPLPEDIVNDGAFIGAWLKTRGGQLVYCPDARVAIEVPSDLGDHLRQRRRILFGHQQVTDRVGVTPTTFGEYLRRHPRRALQVLWEEVRATPGGVTALAELGVGELASLSAAWWDRVPPRRNHRLWETIRDSAGSPDAFESTGVRTSASRAPSGRAE